MEQSDPGPIIPVRIEPAGPLQRAEASKVEILRLRQAVCQLRWRPIFASPVADGTIPSIRGMTCAIIELLRESGAAQKGILAKHLKVHPTRMNEFLVRRRWPNQKFKPYPMFHAAVQWIFLGDRTSTTQVDDDESDLATRRETALEVEEYFFPFGYRDDKRLPPYFLEARRLSESPFDQKELTLVIQWLRRQIRLEQYPGQLIIVAPTSAAVDVFGGEDIRSELIRASVQSKMLKVHFLYNRHGEQFVAKVKKAGSELIHQDPKKWLGEGLHDAPLHPNGINFAENRFSDSLFGYIYLAFGSKEPEGANESLRSKLLILRPLGGGSEDMSLTFSATVRERTLFINWVNPMLKNGEKVLQDATLRIHDRD